MQKPFEITVVMPVYNGAPYLACAIQSALSQTLPPSEIIIVDDGSTDGTSEVLSNFRDKVSIVCQKNRGVSGARNVGIGRARTEWIGFLDQDDIWRPHKLETIARAVVGQDDVGLVFSAVEHWWDGTEHRYVRSRRVDPECKHIYRELAGRNVVLGGGSGAVVRKQSLLDGGLFDEDVRGAEDWDLWIRIARTWRFMYIDEVLISYRAHLSAYSKKSDRMLEANLRVLSKYEPVFLADGFSGRELCRAASQVYLRAGVAYLFSGEREKARPMLWKALQLNPLNTKIWVPMLKLVFGLGRGWTHKSGTQCLPVGAHDGSSELQP